VSIVVQDASHPGEILSRLTSFATSDVTRLRIAVAYVTAAGCDLLYSRLRDRLGTGAWSQIPKTVITSLDFGLTEPAALKLLFEVPNSSVRIARTDALSSPTLRPTKAFHAKTYVFDRSANRAILVGSANLTEAALTTNTEVAYALDLAPDAPSVDSAWQVLQQGSDPLQTPTVDAYSAKRSALGSSIPPEPPTAQLSLPTVAQLPTLWDEIVAGTFNPRAYRCFVVEAGSMSSGGSGNQLELPRGGNRFFDFVFADYGSGQTPIGYPPLVAPGYEWRDRLLAWHGNNRMERLNLPTQTQGGFDYRQTAVLFRRTSRGFALEVAPWDSALAQSWFQAAVAGGRVFRSGRSDRICGFF
jgi:HKD family nuclease